jgi:hypothetical protein
MAVLVAKLIGSRKWTEDANGSITSLSRRYMILRDGIPAGTAAEEILSSDVTGLPQRQSSHSAKHPNLKCDGYSWEEGVGNEKQKLYCDVHYSVYQSELNEMNKPPRGQAVEVFGWRSGSVSRDLVRDAATGQILVNTAGLPFDSVPQIDIPSPTFTKVIKMTARQAWAVHHGKINAASITVGGIVCGAHCLRCVQVDEDRLWNDDFGFKYKYTIGLQLMTNKAVIEGGNAPTEIGWDQAIVSAGTMEKKTPTSEVTPIEIISKTGKTVYASTPVLLDANGKAMLEQGAKPYAKRVQVYETTNFPIDFYVEPL